MAGEAETPTLDTDLPTGTQNAAEETAPPQAEKPHAPAAGSLEEEAEETHSCHSIEADKPDGLAASPSEVVGTAGDTSTSPPAAAPGVVMAGSSASQCLDDRPAKRAKVDEIEEASPGLAYLAEADEANVDVASPASLFLSEGMPSGQQEAAAPSALGIARSFSQDSFNGTLQAMLEMGAEADGEASQNSQNTRTELDSGEVGQAKADSAWFDQPSMGALSPPTTLAATAAAEGDRVQANSVGPNDNSPCRSLGAPPSATSPLSTRRAVAPEAAEVSSTLVQAPTLSRLDQQMWERIFRQLEEALLRDLFREHDPSKVIMVERWTSETWRRRDHLSFVNTMLRVYVVRDARLCARFRLGHKKGEASLSEQAAAYNKLFHGLRDKFLVGSLMVADLAIELDASGLGPNDADGQIALAKLFWGSFCLLVDAVLQHRKQAPWLQMR